MQKQKYPGYISNEMPNEINSLGIFRYALGIEYRGTQYCGWQRQEHPRGIVTNKSVQSEVESALGFVADELVNVVCAGRTDSGVHAYEQVVHFETKSRRPLKAWVLGVNSRLPDDISVSWVKQVSSDFHARFSATARTYYYWIDNRPQRPAISGELMTWIRNPLNVEQMHLGAQSLLGEHDFTSFRGVACQSKTPFRNLKTIYAERIGNKVLIEVTANAFLLHMVRNIVGSLIEVGRGEHPPEWIRQVLESKDRCQAGVTAPANGLYLMSVEYPAQYGLPQAIPVRYFC